MIAVFILAGALAADTPPRVHHVIPWGTVTAMSMVDVVWAFGHKTCDVDAPAQIDYDAGECTGPRIGGGLALMAGPAVLLESEPEGAKRTPGSKSPFPEGGRIDAGLSAGVLFRVDAPRSYVYAEDISQTWGGYFRLGQEDEDGVESRHTLAIGWRRSYFLGGWSTNGTGQLDVTVMTERRLLSFVGIGATVRCAVGTDALPWSVGAGAAVLIGM